MTEKEVIEKLTLFKETILELKEKNNELQKIIEDYNEVSKEKENIKKELEENYKKLQAENENLKEENLLLEKDNKSKETKILELEEELNNAKKSSTEKINKTIEELDDIVGTIKLDVNNKMVVKPAEKELQDMIKIFKKEKS